MEKDSLVFFVSDDGEVEMTEMRRALADGERRHQLAACKHGADAGRLAVEPWPRILCCDDAYVEAIFLEAATHADLRLVRFPRAEYDEIQRIALGNLAGDPMITDEERRLVSRFARLQERLSALDVDLEYVDEPRVGSLVAR